MVDHTIVHFDIPAEDTEKMRRFYTELFGWKIEKVPGPIDYWLIETVPVDEKGMPLRPGLNGGMAKKGYPGQTPINYISVEDIDKYIAKIEELEGKIIMPKQEVTGVGWTAWALDPEGNPFAILQGTM
jgi:predicted enzyme related to lactoylglutathione lyase